MAVTSTSVPRKLDFLARIEFEISNQFSCICESVDFNERLIAERINSLKKYIERTLEENEYTKEDEYRYLYDLGQHIRNSNLFATFSLFESKLLEVFDILNSELALNVDFLKIKAKNGDIGKFRSFLIKTVKIDLSKLDDDFDMLIAHKEIRNAIIHNRGELKKPMSYFFEKKAKINGLVVYNQKVVISSKVYIIDLINFLDKMLANIFNTIDYELEFAATNMSRKNNR